MKALIIMLVLVLFSSIILADTNDVLHAAGTAFLSMSSYSCVRSVTHDFKYSNLMSNLTTVTAFTTWELWQVNWKLNKLHWNKDFQTDYITLLTCNILQYLIRDDEIHYKKYEFALSLGLESAVVVVKF